MAFYSRKATRIPNYDYSACNYYFVTICTHGRRCIFGDPGSLNKIGTIVNEHILRISSYYKGVTIDKYVVMPNHVHMIVKIDGQDHADIPHIIGQYKSGVTRDIRKSFPEMEVWQRSFHDHIIRDQISYEKIWLYIDANPGNWEKDCFFIDKRMLP